MESVLLTLPWPPSVNHYKTVGRTITTKNGKKYQKKVNSKETIAFYYEVYMNSKAQMPLEGVRFSQDSTIALGVTIELYPPDNRRRDADNSLKCLFDSLVHAKVIKDDSQIMRIFIQKMKPVEGGEVKLLVYELE